MTMAGTRVHAFADDALGRDDAVGLVARMRDGEVSAAEIVDAAVARAELVQPALHGLCYQAFDRARAEARDPRAALTAVVSAYADFAERRPALYDAMFVRSLPLQFDHVETPPALREAFSALREGVRPFAGPDDLDVLTELLWAGLHGLVTLMRGGRLPRERQERRIALLCERFTG